jgi:hypothetical protein
MPTSDLSGYRKTDIRPPGPSRDTGYYTTTIKGNTDDSAHYILRPDVEFYRPWIASPAVAAGGPAFVWPLGVEGFTIANNADLGIHKYIGTNDIDVEIIFPSERHITMNGIFPGKTAAQQFRALEAVILHPSTVFGKVLCLPLVAERVLYVTVSNYTFSHDQEDRTGTISYSLEFIQQGAGSQIKRKQLRPPKRNPTTKTSPRGKSGKRRKTTSGTTLRANAAQVYNDPAEQYTVLGRNLNDLTAQTGLAPHQLAYSPLPPGTTLNY